MRPAPRLSIGLPVYNGERYLAESLDCTAEPELREFRADYFGQCLDRRHRRNLPPYMKQDSPDPVHPPAAQYWRRP